MARGTVQGIMQGTAETVHRQQCTDGWTVGGGQWTVDSGNGKGGGPENSTGSALSNAAI
jgi:hypothetical protein